FSVAYGGFVNGDDASKLGGTLAFATSATVGSAVGTYPITPSGLTSANYAISFKDGTLTIGKAALTVTADNVTRLYGAANPAFTGKVDGIQNGDAIAARYSTTATAASPVGTDAIVPAAVDSAPSRLGNYDVKLVNGTLTIAKAGLTVKA